MDAGSHENMAQHLVPDTNEKALLFFPEGTIIETGQQSWHKEIPRSEHDECDTTPSARQSRVDDYFVEATAACADDAEAKVRQRLLSDLLEIEMALKSRKKEPVQEEGDVPDWHQHTETNPERRQHHRVVYPLERCPKFSFAGQSISILDLSQAGMRLMADIGTEHLNIVRGVIAFSDQPAMPVTGKVVWEDELCLGLRLLTRISNRTLENERHLLNA